MKLQKALLITFIFFIVGFTIYIKILGASNIPIDVEKNGYCVKKLGEDWKNIRNTNICKNRYSISQGLEDISFSEVEFRELCPKNNFLSTDFYSDCFKISGGIS